MSEGFTATRVRLVETRDFEPDSGKLTILDVSMRACVDRTRGTTGQTLAPAVSFTQASLVRWERGSECATVQCVF
jgi:hypothetical protein